MIGFLAHYDYWIDLTASILGLLLYVGSTHALQQRRHPAAAVSWILMFVFLPFVAIPAYILFGQRKIKANVERRLPPWPASFNKPGEPAPEMASRGWMSSLLLSLGGAPVRDIPLLTIHDHGDEAERALWQLIDGAQGSLQVSTYVLGDDRIGNELIEHLAKKAAAGVQVRLLLDGVGCFFVRHHQLSPLTKAGGRVARSFPPLRRMLQRQSNFRNHRKMVVADGQRVWMGGRNMADEYFSGKNGSAGWPDLSLIAHGTVAHDAQTVFALDWFWASGERIPMESPEASIPSSQAAQTEPRPQQVQLLASGPDHDQDALQAFLVTACYRAQVRILAVTPYLIPDPALTQALVLAARRGVTVDILLPERSNHLIADLARNRALRELSQAGVSIWLSPQMIHAKAVVFDDMAITGSANLDIRSLFLNFELAVVLYDERSATWLAQWIEQHRRHAERYVPKPASLPRDLFEGAVLWVGFQL